MRIVIILCLRPAPRKVLGPEIPGTRRGPSACSFDCDTNRCHPATPGTQQPPAPSNLWHAGIPDTHKPPGSPLPQGNTPPPNFTCNSPTLLSNFESTSLKFRGFLDIANWSDDRIACEIDGELRWPTPTLRRIAWSALSHPRLTNSHEPTSIVLEFCGLLMSAADTADEL